MKPRDNIRNLFRGETCAYTPAAFDRKVFAPEEIPDYAARGMVKQQEPFPADQYGGLGWFGILWRYEPEVGGAIDCNRQLEDVGEWREKIVFPDLDAIDWQGIADRNRDYLTTDKMLSMTIYTGLFEKLICFMDFEDAAITLIDEDSADDLRELFEALTDFYIGYIERVHRFFGIEYIQFHDDWGTQRAPIMSEAVYREKILPHIARLTEACHKLGIIYEQHSCGYVADLIPAMIEAGVDTWMGQNLGYKEELVRKYGDEFIFGISLAPDTGITDAELMEMIRSEIRRYQGKRVWYQLNTKKLTPEQIRMAEDFLREV